MQPSYGRKILLVEDNESDLQPLRDYLERHGFSVIVAETGRKAMDIITRTLPDLALIDIYLPDHTDGFDVCHYLRKYAEVPIIFITNDDQEETKVRALEEFAEDYVVKPYNMRELVARIGRVLRRCNGPAEDAHAEIIVDDSLHINFTRHWIEVQRSANKPPKRHQLTPIESRILHILIRNAGQVMTTESLLARVWPGVDDAYPEGLRVHVRRLRVKIEPNPSRPNYIVTERGLGYRFAAPIRGKVLAHAVAR
jgi:two-component system response regulator RegX3